MPKASIIVPAFNVSKTLPQTLNSLLNQTFEDFEIVVVDDGSNDDTAQIARAFAADRRVRLIQQRNRGLAGARNTGIAKARGEYVGFCDADDLWQPKKLASHITHLERAPEVGLSFSGSELIDDDGNTIGVSQRPRLRAITAAHVFKRNPIGNGSAAVMRRAALVDLGYRPKGEKIRDWVFDETFRQSEDVECWLRLVLTTGWKIEGVPGLLTRYRINSGGLSAGIDRQFKSWERIVEKLRPLDPGFFRQHEPAARAYQFRYLARRAISNYDPDRAKEMIKASLAQSWKPVFQEPLKTTFTMLACGILSVFGPGPIKGAVQILFTSRPLNPNNRSVYRARTSNYSPRR
jgi:glycosyltransferase involved in cell wall biosynthesis